MDHLKVLLLVSELSAMYGSWCAGNALIVEKIVAQLAAISPAVWGFVQFGRSAIWHETIHMYTCTARGLYKRPDRAPPATPAPLSSCS